MTSLRTFVLALAIVPALLPSAVSAQIVREPRQWQEFRPPAQQQQPEQPQQERAPQPEPAAVPPPERISNPVAKFSGLDKVTGRIVTFDVKIDETVQFGALQVTPRVCTTRPPTEQPETSGFIEVDEITLQNETKRIFAGWMFADSPGLNAVEHPIYDIWLTDCAGGERREAPEGPKLGE